MIDIHMHVGRLHHFLRKALPPCGASGLTDKHGIERATLLSIENPAEGTIPE